MHGNLRYGENQPRDIIADCCAFGARALHELEPRGDIVKEIRNLDAGAARSRGAPMLNQVSAFIANSGAELVVFRLRLKAHARNGRDRGQRLTAKPERTNRKQIVRRRNLAGCVP